MLCEASIDREIALINRFVAAAVIAWLTAVPLAYANSAAAPGRFAPNFSLKDLNGKVRHFSDYRGKLVIVNFWATWCPPCRMEIPSMERAYEKLKNRGFVILGIDVGENWSSVAPFAEQMKMKYPVLLDRNSTVSRKWGMIGLPTSYVIDPHGRVVDVLVGGRNWLDPKLQALLIHLLPHAPGPAISSRRPATGSG